MVKMNDTCKRQSRGIMSGPLPKKLPNPERPCIQCGTPHRHNAPFCSRECHERHTLAKAALESQKRHANDNIQEWAERIANDVKDAND